MLIFTVLCTNHFNPYNRTTCLMKLFALKMTTGLFEHVEFISGVYLGNVCETNVVCAYCAWS